MYRLYKDVQYLCPSALNGINYKHIFASPSLVHVFPNARNKLIIITTNPNKAQISAGSFVREYKETLDGRSFI